MADTLFKLNTGVSISALGLGTWQSAQGQVKKAVSHALASGYKHIDCAYVYGNEDEVGEGLRESFESGVVRREDIFVTTKLWCVGLTGSCRPEPVSKGDVRNDPRFPKHPDGSRDLDSSWTHIQTYQQMERLLHTGKVKMIGVANYSVQFLQELLPHVSAVPAVNQIENHPYLPQQDMVDFCRSKGIHITAYSPLGSAGSPLLQDEHVAEVARRYDVPASAVLLSYHLARGSSVLAKSVTPSRIDGNRRLVKLDASDMAALENIHVEKGVKRFVYPKFGVSFGFPDKQ